jgi:hypothetical protein
MMNREKAKRTKDDTINANQGLKKDKPGIPISEKFRI